MYSYVTVCSIRMTVLQRSCDRGRQREERSSSYADRFTANCCSHFGLTCISLNWEREREGRRGREEEREREEGRKGGGGREGGRKGEREGGREGGREGEREGGREGEREERR